MRYLNYICPKFWALVRNCLEEEKKIICHYNYDTIDFQGHSFVPRCIYCCYYYLSENELLPDSMEFSKQDFKGTDLH